MFLNHIGTSKSIQKIYYKTIIVIYRRILILPLYLKKYGKKYPNLKNKQKNKTDRAGI